MLTYKYLLMSIRKLMKELSPEELSAIKPAKDAGT